MWTVLIMALCLMCFMAGHYAGKADGRAEAIEDCDCDYA